MLWRLILANAKAQELPLLQPLLLHYERVVEHEGMWTLPTLPSRSIRLNPATADYGVCPTSAAADLAKDHAPAIDRPPLDFVPPPTRHAVASCFAAYQRRFLEATTVSSALVSRGVE